MEILKDKKIIVGSLAVIGGIALVAYLLKPKAPKRNSEGFFDMTGFSPKPPMQQILPISQGNCNLPDNFVRIVTTNKNGITKSYCARYDRIIRKTPKGDMFFQYRRQSDIPFATFINGNFYNSNNQIIITPQPEIISNSDYEFSYIKLQECPQNIRPQRI
jgi:hypothetical protein